MSQGAQDDVALRIVGIAPALPWPLSAWRWWTQPVAAERLAALRIGLAMLLLADILCTYLPNLDRFFADGAGSGPTVFGWYAREPRWTWSILRGLGDPLINTLLLLGWIGLGLGIIFDWFTRSTTTSSPIGTKWRVAWLLLGLALIGSSWGRVLQGPVPVQFFWAAPALIVGAALVMLAAEIFLGLVGRPSRSGFWMACVAVALSGFLLGSGIVFDVFDLDAPLLKRVLSPWQEDSELLHLALWIWIAATGMLALGLQTRIAAIVTFVLNASFANANPNIDNAGDVIRYIIVFYLMISPCGAVWSIDRLWQRLHQPAAQARVTILISPWALRLLFIQLALIYFMNGIYKLGGSNWLSGDSLYYVLCDITLTRFSYAQFPVPFLLTRIMTWSVLVWEVGFPLFVSIRWTRPWTLCFGVLFHVGIYVTMELGNFAPYILSLYLPLLPWEKLSGLPFRTRRCGLDPAT